MKYIVALILLSVTALVGVFVFEESYVKSLSEDNRFKKWWRRNVIGELPPDEDL